MILFAEVMYDCDVLSLVPSTDICAVIEGQYDDVYSLVNMFLFVSSSYTAILLLPVSLRSTMLFVWIWMPYDHPTKSGYLFVWAYAVMTNKYSSTLFNDTAMCDSDGMM